MAIETAIRATIDRSFALTEELVREISDSALTARLPGIRSNTLGQQL